MKSRFLFGNGPGSSTPIAPSSVDESPVQESVGDRAMIAAMSAMAAVIEEPYCIVPDKELRGLVRAFRLCHLAYFGEGRPDYCYRNGGVFCLNGSLVKASTYGALEDVAKA